MLARLDPAIGKTVAPEIAPFDGDGDGNGPNLWRSTDDVPETQRLDYWQHVVGEMIGGVELRDCATDDFACSFELSTVGDLRIGRFTGVSQTLDRKAELIKSSDPDDFIVVLESHNPVQIEQNGRHRSGHGGMVLVDITQPYFSSHPEDLDVIDVFIPRPVMERALGSARQAAGLALDASQPSFPIIAAFLRAMNEHGGRLDPVSAARMSSIAVDLIASGFSEKLAHDSPRQIGGAAVIHRAQAYISGNLGVTGLGLQEIAAALNMSVRRLHQIASGEGISLVDWMWERRLLRAHRLLADPANHAQSVGAIAFDCGFVDQAHFSRRFKTRFGRAPSEIRAAPHLGGRPDPDARTP